MRANHARQVSRMPTRDCKAGESAKRQSASCMEGLCVGRASFALLLFFHSSLVLRTTGGAAGEAALVRARSMMRNFHPANLHEYVYSTRSCVRLRGGGACLPVMDENKTQLPTQVADVEDLNVKLHKAATCGRTDKVLKCVSDGAEVDCVNNQQQTALLLASEKGHVETVRALIENGAAKDFVDSKESNALHYAAYNGHLGTIQALAEMGVDVNALNKFGYSPLQYACADGAIEAVEMLLSLGADVHSHDKMRWTALHRAAGAGHLEVVQTLLNHGADVNWPDLQNYTALHEASWCGHVEIAATLVDAGADLRQTDLWGNSALDLAFSQAREGKDELYTYLNSYSIGTKSNHSSADDDAATRARLDDILGLALR